MRSVQEAGFSQRMRRATNGGATLWIMPIKITLTGNDKSLLEAGGMFFFNRSAKQREDILTNQMASNTHVIARETQIFQCAAIN